MRRSLTKTEKLRNQAEIKSLFAIGKPYSCKGLKLWYKPNTLIFNRVLFSPSRQYANAVLRNETKRYGREIYRLCKYQIKPGFDIIFLFYPGDYSFQSRQEQMISLLKRSNLIGKD